MYYYNYRHKTKDGSSGPVVLRSSIFDTNLQKYREKRGLYLKTNSIPIYPSITHCSYCYKDISSIQNKLHSFAHSEFNKSPYTDREYIIDCIKNHTNFFWKEKFEVVDLII